MYTLGCVALTLLVVACGPTHVVVQSDVPPPPPPPPPVQQAPPPAITYQTFYDALSPYGQWVDYPGTGYVWVPNMGPDFKPYSSGGHWVYSDEGWTWASDYPWGWAPFHYGRWFFDDNYGWCWVPGYQWAPAWVSWRSNQGYYGWAPLSPTVGVSVTIAAYNPPPHVWCFVPAQYVASPHVNNYYVNETQNVTIIQKTTIINNYTTVNNIHNTTVNNTTINNTTVNNNTVNNNTVINNRNVFVAGPPKAEVEAVTHTQIHPVTFRESSTPGSAGVAAGGQMAIYRPAVSTPPASASGSVHTPAPARVAPFKQGATPAPESGATRSVTPANESGAPRPVTPPRENQQNGYPQNHPPVPNVQQSGQVNEGGVNNTQAQPGAGRTNPAPVAPRPTTNVAPSNGQGQPNNGHTTNGQKSQNGQPQNGQAGQPNNGNHPGQGGQPNGNPKPKNKKNSHPQQQGATQTGQNGQPKPNSNN